MTLSSFTIAALGMRAQSTGLHVIGTNVSNVQTGGFKRADAHFQTVLSETVFEQSDIGGTRPKILHRNSIQGTLQPTSSGLDLAIVGDGFFVTRSTFDTSGETIYTRDGAFEKSVLNELTLTDPNTGDVFTTKDAYLVDKNGNYVLGYEAAADGTFPTNGTPVPLRVDQNAFIDMGTATSAAELGLNLDSNAAVVDDQHITAVSNFDSAALRPDGMEVFTINYIDSNGNQQDARLNFTKAATNLWDVSATYQGSGTAQIDTVTIDGVVDVGDSYDVTVNGQTVSYTVATGDTQTEIIAGLVAAVNANATIAANVTAAAGTTAGTLTLTANATGTAFTASADSTNGPDVAQVSTIAITGTLEVGDVYTVNIGGASVSKRVDIGDTLANVVTSLLTSINADATMGPLVTATTGANPGEITVTADTAGSVVGIGTAVVDRGQTDTLTLAGTVEVGDIYTATIDGTPVSYTVAAGDTLISDVRDGLVTAINASGVNGTVDAVAGAAAGELVLVADTAGTAFTTVPSTTNIGLNPDDAMTVVSAAAGSASAIAATTTTAAVAATDDNTATSAATVAAQATLQSTAVTRLTFLGDGTLSSPDAVSLSFTIPATATDPVATATFDLDVSGLSQFANSFLFQRYSENGFEAATMNDIGFDSAGRVIGFFDNGRSRELYQIPLAKFSNPDALETHNGMTFTETTGSGEPDIQTVSASGIASFSPFTREISNVSIVDEFTAMIQTQQAYNSSAQAFKTADEMYQILNQMKR